MSADQPTVREAMWTKAKEVLGDGQWHNYEAAIREIGTVIPPGVALRTQERERIKSMTTPRASEQRTVPLDLDRRVESGRRAMVRVLFKHRCFETDKPGHTRNRVPDRKIRMVT